MSPFVFSSLAWWAIPLAGVPVLIHLINLLRHRRVQWAAMEFLLQSQRRNRTWVLLKQLLLLLLRMAALAAVALMVAQPILRSGWSAILGGGKTHHIVLLDDSFSMSDSWKKTTAFDEAVAVVRRLGGQIARQNSAQTFTLLRFSRAGHAGHGTEPDLAAESVDSQFEAKLQAICSGLKVSELANGPDEALDAILRMPDATADEKRVVYLVSDFRANQWENPTALRKTLQQLEAAGAKIQLVECADEMRPNLAINSLKPLGGTRAVGVPLTVEASVKNFGAQAVHHVTVQLEEDGHELPSLDLEEIKPGDAATKQFEVAYLTAGEHRITARLAPDGVAADNVRYAVLNIPAYLPVLVIDGNPRAAADRSSDARFVMDALAPGGNVPTGIRPQLEAPRFLRDKPLADFYAIYLLNVDRLDGSEIEALEKYARSGGGVAFFLGDLSRADFITHQLYRGGEGLFPAPLVAPTELLVDKLAKSPDLQIVDHPIFRIFAGERNQYIASVNIERYFAVEPGWKPDADSHTQVIARLRNGAPLAIDRQFGDGRVVAFLTTAAPHWNNWARNPSFVVALQGLQSYLAIPREARPDRPVGSPLEVKFDPAKFARQVRFVAVGKGATGVAVMDASPSGDALSATFSDADAAGFYEAQLSSLDGNTESRLFAFNVQPEEGNLRMLDSQQLASRLAGLDYQSAKAEDLAVGTQDLSGANLSSYVLYGLVGLLLGEQVLAYSASYHPSRREARR